MPRRNKKVVEQKAVQLNQRLLKVYVALKLAEETILDGCNVLHELKDEIKAYGRYKTAFWAINSAEEALNDLFLETDDYRTQAFDAVFQYYRETKSKVLGKNAVYIVVDHLSKHHQGISNND